MREGEFISICPSRDKGADEFWVDFTDLEVDGMVSLQEIGHRSERPRLSSARLEECPGNPLSLWCSVPSVLFPTATLYNVKPSRRRMCRL